MKLCRLVQLIRDEHFHELRTQKEKQFIEDMYDGLDGLPPDTIDEDVDDYLTLGQIQWIRDIGVFLCLTE